MQTVIEIKKNDCRLTIKILNFEEVKKSEFKSIKKEITELSSYNEIISVRFLLPSNLTFSHFGLLLFFTSSKFKILIVSLQSFFFISITVCIVVFTFLYLSINITI